VTRIGIVGTFDVMNFGDLLFPLLAGHELRERLGDVTLTAYSHRELAPPGWPYPVRPLDSLPHDLETLDLLLVGGGHLVRFDKDIAPGYGPTSPDVHHPTGYWLTPTLVAGVAGVPVAWNAVGASSDTPGWARPLLAAALDLASYVSVRDEVSARELRAISGSAKVELVPDTAFGVTRLLPVEPTENLRGLLATAGVSQRYLVVQASPQLNAHADRIAAAVAPLREAGISVLEVPISPAHGDEGKALGVGHPLMVEPWPAPLVLAELIGRAEAVVALSLHLSIVALAQGVPVYRPASTHEKYRLLEQFQGVHTWDGAGPRLALEDLGRRELGAENAKQSVRLAEHWDAVATLVGGPRQPRSARLAALLAEVTAALENGARAISS
jgi:lipopolysaccharide transport system ATP-binding protein